MFKLILLERCRRSDCNVDRNRRHLADYRRVSPLVRNSQSVQRGRSPAGRDYPAAAVDHFGELLQRLRESRVRALARLRWVVWRSWRRPGGEFAVVAMSYRAYQTVRILVNWPGLAVDLTQARTMVLRSLR
jgi:hypothetical protein